MGQVLPGNARTTPALRAAIARRSQSLHSLAHRPGSHPKTGAKGRKRTLVTEAPMGPKPASTVLTAEEEALAGAFRRHTLRALDEGLYARQATIPRRTRSALHGLFQRPGIERLPWSEDAANPAKNKCKDYPMGYWPGDFAQVHPQEGKHYLFVALDRVGKVAFAELPPRAKRVGAADLLRRGRQALPDQAHTVLPDTVGPFPPPPQQGLPRRPRRDRACRAVGVGH